MAGFWDLAPYGLVDTDQLSEELTATTIRVVNNVPRKQQVFKNKTETKVHETRLRILCVKCILHSQQCSVTPMKPQQAETEVLSDTTTCALHTERSPLTHVTVQEGSPSNFLKLAQLNWIRATGPRLNNLNTTDVCSSKSCFRNSGTPYAETQQIKCIIRHLQHTWRSRRA